MAEMEYDKLRPFVSHGGIAMVREGLHLKENHPDFDERKQQFLNIYKDNIANETRLFPGMDIVIDALDKKNIPWGIVTNKPEWLTHPLLKKLNLNERSKVTICGDTLPQRKPDPTPLLEACKIVGVAPENCIYIGDAERDIEAGRNAGIKSYIATFGYIGDNDNTDDWNADGMIASPEDLIKYL